MKRILLLGSTGSIGRTTLEVLQELRSSHKLVGIAAHRSVEALCQQVLDWQPEAVAVVDGEAGREVNRRLVRPHPQLFQGANAAAKMVEQVEADLVLSGIAGAAGLQASLAAVHRGCDLALANKESMVMAGPVLLKAAQHSRSRIIPVDSEHSAIFQCLQGQPYDAIRKVILTASGGPFRSLPGKDLDRVTPEQALRHPTWNMGDKITIDSATLMNKALEVIEARWLFDVPAERIAAVVHPQSIVHSMVEFCDGSVLAQLGVPDMAVPIRYALSYPDRSSTSQSYFDLERFRTLTFEEPDIDRFPGLRLGFEAARRGGTAGAVLNAANEVAVDSFLRQDIRFPQIAEAVERSLDQVTHIEDPSLDEILLADQRAREEAAACCC